MTLSVRRLGRERKTRLEGDGGTVSLSVDDRRHGEEGREEGVLEGEGLGFRKEVQIGRERRKGRG